MVKGHLIFDLILRQVIASLTKPNPDSLYFVGYKPKPVWFW